MAHKTRHSCVLLCVVPKSGKILGRLTRYIIDFGRGRQIADVGEEHDHQKQEQQSARRDRTHPVNAARQDLLLAWQCSHG